MSKAAHPIEPLLAALADRTLTADERTQLADLLRDDAPARALYRRYLRIHLLLDLETGGLDTAVPEVALDVTPAPHADAEPAPGEASGHAPRPIPFIIYPISIAAALLFTAAMVGVYLFAFATDPQPDPIKPNQPGPAVATLIEVSGGGDLRTPHGFPAEGDDYGRGEYTLSTGTAEFMLTNAVNVKLRGDTRMVMRNNMNVALARGSADFVVPTDAKGFTVHLPGDTRVVDLGTQFSVELDDDDGTPEVHVAQGLVQLHTAERTIDITADNAWRIDPIDGPVPAPFDIPLVNADFESPALADFHSGGLHQPAEGWRTHGPNLIAVYNPDRQFYPDSLSTDPDSGVLPGMSGPQVLFLYNTAPGYAEQTTEHRVLADRTYTLTVAVGRRNDTRKFPRAPGAIELRSGDRLLATTTLPPESEQQQGSFIDASLFWTPTDDDPAIGQPLTVRLVRHATAKTSYIDLDHVRLSHLPLAAPAVSVPDESPSPTGDSP